jgi:hypothetical protein
MSVSQPNLDKFYTAAGKLGFSKKYNFQVESIDGLPVSIQGLVNNLKEYTLYVQSAKAPSRKINITKVPYKAFEFVVPTNASYPDNESWDIEFISDNDLLIRGLFEEWSKVMYDSQTNSTSDVNFGKCNLQLNLLTDIYDTLTLKARVYTLYGIFPTLLNTMEYNITDTGAEVMKFRVTMAYQYYTVTTANGNLDQGPQKFKTYAGPNKANTQPANDILSTISNIAGVVRGVGGAAKALRNASKAIKGK